MGFFDRVRNLVIGRGFRDTPVSPPEPAPEPQRQPEPERRGILDRLRDRVTGADRQREEQERQAQEVERLREEARQEQERQRQEIQRQQEELARQREEIRQEQERLRQEREQLQRAEQERREAERQEQERERQEQERQRVEQERQAQERQRQEQEQRDREQWQKEVGIDREVTGGKVAGVSWTIYTVRTPEELMERLRDATDAGKRVGLSVHDKNGWQQLYVNQGRGQAIDPRTGMLIGGGSGMSASELRDRLEKYGVPGGEPLPSSDRTVTGIGDFPSSDGDIDLGEGGVLDGPEWDYDDADDGGDYDVDESEGADEDNEYAGYDGASVNGYQLVVY